MATKMITGWVTEDGEFGYGSIVIFGINELSAIEWHQLNDASDRDRIVYVEAATMLIPGLREGLKSVEGYEFSEPKKGVGEDD
jgi:hypothetical protein